jgi:hypothetical protein
VTTTFASPVSASSSLAAAAELATATILIASAVTGFRALVSGTLPPPHRGQLT